MSEEVTYADLKFQNSSKIQTIQEFDQVDIKAPAPSHGWRRRALALALLCLLLLIGLGVLGSVFHRTYKMKMKKLKELQNSREKLERNVSLQLMHNMNSSEKIRNLSITLQDIATKLCYELYRKEREHKCNPCPKKWMWYEDSCYVAFRDYKTWSMSDRMCSTYNASLLTIKNKRVLEFIKSLTLYDFWLGLSPSKEDKGYKKLDEKIMSSDWVTRNTSDLNARYCAYIRNTYIYYIHCTEKKYTVCEKLADQVKIESTLMNEAPDGRV